MKNIDEMSEGEAKDLIKAISRRFGIGGASVSGSVLLTNIENAVRRSSCLSEIERFHTVRVDDTDDDDPIEDQLLNWGDSPADYLENYKQILAMQPNTERS